jgi:hypothetical protein
MPFENAAQRSQNKVFVAWEEGDGDNKLRVDQYEGL